MRTREPECSARSLTVTGLICYDKPSMKAHVYVNLKKTVLDPQGETIRAALQGLGFSSVQAVRQGKHFELQLNSGSEADARAEVERIAKEVLTNPVIEEFSYRLEA
jgi:phosphoribosylformylglycinamidine synthase PurS subunit